MRTHIGDARGGVMLCKELRRCVCMLRLIAPGLCHEHSVTDSK